MAANNQDLEKFDQSQTIGCESGDGKAAAEALSALLDRVEKNVYRSSTKVDLPDMTIAGGNDAEAQDLSQWENALVQGPTRRTEVTDVSTAPHAGGAGSTKDQLKSIGIQAERTDLLPQGMQEDLKPFLDARDQQQRNQAIRDLQVRVDSGKEATPHAKFALQQARLLDAAIRLEQAEKRRDQLRGTPGFKDADGEITRIVREIVRLEGAQGADATAFLNGHTAHVHKGNAAERTPSKLEGFDTKVKAVRADEARQNELAIDLLAPDPMKRAVRQKPTPADYATALERLQSMAERDDRRAIELLAPIKNQVPALLKDLRNPNPEVAINARNRLETQLVRPKEMGVKVRDLLSDVNPEDLRKAREAEQKAIEGNLNGIAQSVDSFSTVSNGKVADRQQREKAIAEVRQQVSGSNEERLVPVIDWMESTNAKLKIIESANPKAAADEIRKLYEYAQKPLAEDRPNVHAGSALQKICGKENLTDLLQKLESSDPAIAAHALKELKDRLPQKDIVDDLNDHRARALLVQLPKDYKSSDLEVLIKKLEPAANDNEPVKDVLNWAKTEIELKRIQEAQGNPELVSKSVEQLITLAASDNTYARLALAGMLLKDQEAAGWQKHVMSKSSERPLAIDARQSLGTNEASTEATQLRIVRALEQLAQKNPKKVTEAEACAVALAATHAPKGSELRSTAERTLQQHVRENNAVHAGVFEAIKLKEGRDDQHILSRLFLDGCTLDRKQNSNAFNKQYNELVTAANDKEEANRVIVGIAYGHELIPGNNETKRYVDHARNAVERLSNQESSKRTTLNSLRDVGEKEITRLETFYQHGPSKANEDIADGHDSIANAYERCGDKNEAERHRYEAQEIRRVNQHFKRMTENPDKIEAAFDALRKLPDGFNLKTNPASNLDITFGRRGLLNMVESVPGFRISRPLNQFLGGVEGLKLEGDTLTITGRGQIDIPPEALDPATAQLLRGQKLSFQNLTAKVEVKDGKLFLRNVRGVSAGLIPIVRTMELSIDNTNPDSPVLKIEGLSKDSRISIPLDKAQAKQFQQLTEELSKPQESRDLRKLSAAFAGGDQSITGKLIGTMDSFTREKDTFKITGKEASSIEVGGRKLNLDKAIEFKVNSERGEQKLTDIKGMSIDNPLPADVQKRLGKEGPINIKEIQFGKLRANGERELRIISDPPLEYVSITLDKDMKPVGKDISFGLKIDGKQVDATLTLDSPEKGMDGNWSLNLKGDQEARKKVLESFGTPPNIAEALKDVQTIKKFGNNFQIELGKDNPAKITIPADIGQKGFMNSDWEIRLSGSSNQNEKLLKNLGVPSDVAAILKESEVISREGDTITRRGEPVEIDRGGVKLRLENTVTVKLKESGNDTTLSLTGVKLTDVPLQDAPEWFQRRLRANALPEQIKKITLSRDSEGNINRMTIDEADQFIKPGTTIEFDKDMQVASADIRLQNVVSKVLFGSADTETRVLLKKEGGQLVCTNRADLLIHSTAGAFWESKLSQGVLLANPVTTPIGIAVTGLSYLFRRP